MGTVIENILIEDLEEGRIFEKDELIIYVDGISMTTIRRELESKQVGIFMYDFHKINEERYLVHNMAMMKLI